MGLWNIRTMTETEIDKSTQCEVSGLFKDFDFHLVQLVDTSLIKMNYWLFNTIPLRTVYDIFARIRQFVARKRPVLYEL